MISCIPLSTYAQNRSKVYSTILKIFLCCLNTQDIFSNCLKFSRYSTPFIDVFAFISMVSSTDGVFIQSTGISKSCARLDYLSISWLIEHLLCPDSQRFPSSAFKLYEWACIYNEEALLNCFLFFVYNCSFLTRCILLFRCHHCMS